jgi:hypothetical protein
MNNINPEFFISFKLDKTVQQKLFCKFIMNMKRSGIAPAWRENFYCGGLEKSVEAWYNVTMMG